MKNQISSIFNPVFIDGCVIAVRIELHSEDQLKNENMCAQKQSLALQLPLFQWPSLPRLLYMRVFFCSYSVFLSFILIYTYILCVVFHSCLLFFFVFRSCFSLDTQLYILHNFFFTFSFFFQYSFDFCVLCSFQRMYCQYIHSRRSTRLTHANRYTVRSYKYHSFSSMALAFFFFRFFFLYSFVTRCVSSQCTHRQQRKRDNFLLCFMRSLENLIFSDYLFFLFFFCLLASFLAVVLCLFSFLSFFLSVFFCFLFEFSSVVFCSILFCSVS